MRRNGKRILALFLSLLMLFPPTASARAEESILLPGSGDAQALLTAIEEKEQVEEEEIVPSQEEVPAVKDSKEEPVTEEASLKETEKIDDLTPALEETSIEEPSMEEKETIPESEAEPSTESLEESKENMELLDETENSIVPEAPALPEAVPEKQEAKESGVGELIFPDLPLLAEEPMVIAMALAAESAPTGAGVKVVKEDGTEFAMFKVSSSTAKVSGDKIEITLTTQNVSYNGIYLGSKDDAAKEPVIEGSEQEEGGFTFQFEVSASESGKNIPIALRKKSDGSWYSKALFLAVPEVSVPSKPEQPEAGVKVVKEDGTEFAMFKVSSSTAKVSGDKIEITLTTQNVSYNGIYLGSKDDAAKEPVIEGSEQEGGGFTFQFEVSASESGKNIPIALRKKSDGSWYSKALFLAVPEISNPSNPEEPENPNPPVDPDEPKPGTIVDGNYQTEVETGAAMFKVVDCILTVKNGKMSAVITLSGTGYDYLYLGTAADAGAADRSAWIPAVKNEAGQYTYTIPVEALDTKIAVASHSQKQDKWYDRSMTFRTASLKRVIENGIYRTTVETGAAMFKVVDCILTVKDGVMSAVVTLSGTGYDYLYLGTAADASAADRSTWIPAVKNEAGQYTYTIPVEALDTKIAVASHSQKQDKWYDRSMTISSATLEKIAELEDAGMVPPVKEPDSPSNEPADNNTADEESKYDSDTSGSTKQVDSSTVLKDGVYTPDRFSWSGGTGRVSISCNKVTVKNGQAYATLVFSSNSFSYVKANGNVYYGSHGSKTSTFVIPVALNKNNTILGMTTAMSAGHEISYRIFVYLAAAENGGQTGGAVGNETLDEKAPDILGLEYKEETKLEHAEYFKLYHYNDGITLLEIDLTKDTARDPAKKQEETAKTQDEGKEAKKAEPVKQAVVSEEEGMEEAALTQAEITAELYQGNVVKYLLVPDGAEIPVGLEKEMVVVNLPAKSVYAGTNEILKTLESLELLSVVTSVGCEKKECELSAVADAMEPKAGESKAKILFGGSFELFDYKSLLSSRCDLILLPGDILPREVEESEKEATAKPKTGEAVLTVPEQIERWKDGMDRLAILDMPVIVDRSADEKTELARSEWVKVYGVLFGCEKEAEALYAAVEKEQSMQKVSQ
ncbi:hypothetical protein [Hominifimenecus sp. rT4P-3]|uniref:hypothetical protein n=1 Tax=Hominifimenecus sp. rT4P-3 TaxID=3242979 RepID=UPI003DA6B637